MGWYICLRGASVSVYFSAGFVSVILAVLLSVPVLAVII